MGRKNTDSLRAAFERMRRRPGFRDEVLRLTCSDQPSVREAASWLVKHAIDQGIELNEAQTIQWLRRVETSQSWPVLLHVLQTIRQLSIPDSQIKSLWQSLKPLGVHDNRMVRTWVLDAMARVADQAPRYRRTVRLKVGEVGEDAAPSMRARVRRLRKELDWLHRP